MRQIKSVVDQVDDALEHTGRLIGKLALLAAKPNTVRVYPEAGDRLTPFQNIENDIELTLMQIERVMRWPDISLFERAMLEKAETTAKRLVAIRDAITAMP